MQTTLPATSKVFQRRPISKKTAEEKNAQRRELMDRAEQGLAELAQAMASSETTAALESWLKFAGNFHRYSMWNQILIHRQRPTATRCAGFNGWKRVGRWVRKGEKGIAILAPVFGKRIEKDEATGEETVTARWTNFRTVYVFDVEQTEGEPLPIHPATNLEQAQPDDLARVENALRQLCPIVEDAQPLMTGVMGWTDGKTIHVSAGQSTGSRLSVLVHEAAHYLLHFGEDRKAATSAELHQSRNMFELEAEATACAVTTALGYSFQGFAAAYVRSYGATPETLAASLPRIQKAVGKLLGLILDGEDQADGAEVAA